MLVNYDRSLRTKVKAFHMAKCPGMWMTFYSPFINRLLGGLKIKVAAPRPASQPGRLSMAIELR